MSFAKLGKEFGGVLLVPNTEGGAALVASNRKAIVEVEVEVREGSIVGETWLRVDEIADWEKGSARLERWIERRADGSIRLRRSDGYELPALELETGGLPNGWRTLLDEAYGRARGGGGFPVAVDLALVREALAACGVKRGYAVRMRGHQRFGGRLEPTAIEAWSTGKEVRELTGWRAVVMPFEVRS